MRAEAYKTLQTLDKIPEAYLVQHSEDKYLVANGQGYAAFVAGNAARWLIQKGYVAKRYHPAYYFITEAGRKKL